MSDDKPIEPAGKSWLIRAFDWLMAQPKVRDAVVAALTALFTAFITWIGTRPGPQPPTPPEPSEPVIVRGGAGWVPPTEQESEAAIASIAAFQGMPAKFGQIARDLEANDADKSAFHFEAENKVLGKRLQSWNQGSVGTCVSFGFGRGAQDLLLGQIASGSPEQWAEAEVATEPIYGGSRVEVGGGRIRGDGSVGAWAAQWVQKWGVLFRKTYGAHDLRNYSESLSRDWGRRGVPDDLEPIARQHPIKTVAQINSAAELWAALGNGYPVPVCSDVGFEGALPADGIMSPRGSWAHCMLFRGRFVHPVKGKCVVVQNSWGNYLGRAPKVQTTDRGDVELPEGCFAVTLATAGKMVAQRDTFALSGFAGFPRQAINWPVRARPKRDVFGPMFAWAW